MMEVDAETREHFRRLVDVVIERTSATDQRIEVLREEHRDAQDRMLTALDAVAHEVKDLRVEYYAVTAALSRLDASTARWAAK